MRCNVCEGTLELRYPGAPVLDLSPTNHRAGEHGDLYRCPECGAVHQPSLPSGEELVALYAEMDDPAYLDEEAGRRRTAARLLGLVGERVAAGSLLDVGCGHGLLLDEARRRGWDVLGVEPSRAGAAYAREVLGLEVIEGSLDDLPADARFDAVVLADVIEHVDDPVATIARCAGLLAPGGVMCVVTPDPSSFTARIAGRGWWGYLPAHACLLPRRTLRELLAARGLVVTDDVPLVRTFTLAYWAGGLAERPGLAGRLARAALPLLPRRMPVSLSLGDERVVVAQRAEVVEPPRKLARPRSGPARVHVVMPAYRAEATVGRVAEGIPLHAVDRVLLVDDASPDRTVERALDAGLEVIRHPANRGYGGNQKTCYTRAILDGADVVVMVHADNQYDPALVADMVAPIVEGRADVVIGSRLLEDEAIAGGMPRWKWVGNRLLTAIENRAFDRGFSEYHTGYRAFSTALLRELPFLRNSDGFVFDQEIFAQLVARGARVVEIPIPTRYFLEASSVSFRASVEYGLRTLGVLARYRLHRSGRRWALLERPAARFGATAGGGAKGAARGQASGPGD